MNKHDREAMAAFFAQVDEDGISNAEKAETRHHVIRRIETTSKDKSYEDADESIDNRADGLPIGVVEVDGKLEIAHVPNTGRCKELLVPGATVYLEKSDNPDRKTLYDLIAVYKGKAISTP